ncbi:hypothetical protein ACFS32_24330 [Novosphingobium pokkalii]|uniref:hypothetical protein n=1 Tax=Novosphingobium pokkalii TaxID=1770194 RepID=UPI00363E6077
MFITPMMAAYRQIVAQGVREGTMVDVDPALLYYALVGAADHIFSRPIPCPLRLAWPRSMSASSRPMPPCCATCSCAGCAQPAPEHLKIQPF